MTTIARVDPYAFALMASARAADLARLAPTPASLAPTETIGQAEDAPRRNPNVADLLTLTGYALGLWWCVGGPTWAGLASIALDEIDGYVARRLGIATPIGSILDSTADVALVPMSLLRLGRATGHEGAALAAAVPILYVQAETRDAEQRPPLLSFRAVIMLTTMAIEALET